MTNSKKLTRIQVLKAAKEHGLIIHSDDTISNHMAKNLKEANTRILKLERMVDNIPAAVIANNFTPYLGSEFQKSFEEYNNIYRG